MKRKKSHTTATRGGGGKHTAQRQYFLWKLKVINKLQGTQQSNGNENSMNEVLFRWK